MTILHVIIASVGRPATLCQTVNRLVRQTRRPDAVIVAATTPDDVGDLAGSIAALEILFAPKGSSIQRNVGIDRHAGTPDILLFLDDDFVLADDYVAALLAVFAADPTIAGVTGRLLTDGATGTGLDFAEAVALLDNDRSGRPDTLDPVPALYGCNMAIRCAAAPDLRFDPALPLYAWLEDHDFSVRLSRHGRLVRAGAAVGVHMGRKGGRTSGTRFGYSQIANPLYLLRKGSLSRSGAATLILRPLLANLAKAVRPEPHIDRRGRLAGNLRAIGDLMTRRIHPNRILDIG